MKVNIYKSGIGINNKIKEHRLPFNEESGVSAFKDAENIVVDPTGEAVALKGTSEIASGDYHSIFPGEEWGLIALNRTNDTAIYKVDVSETGATVLTGIQSGFTRGARFDFCKPDDYLNIYYTNGFGRGTITPDCTFIDWTESNRTSETKNFAVIPIPDHICYAFGRIFFSVDNVIYYTEYGHLGMYDQSVNGEQLPSKIIAMVPTVDGIYVSDRDSIHFLNGLNPKKWNAVRVLDYPAKEWGTYPNKINPYLLGFDTNTPCGVLATKRGPVICLPSGNIENLIEGSINMPDCPDIGAIAVFDETLIIQTGE